MAHPQDQAVPISVIEDGEVGAMMLYNVNYVGLPPSFF
jgi:hypothetical protein